MRGLRLVVFDFDGVFTDNAVYVGADGMELVRCWRGDGFGLAALRREGIALWVLSTEVNPVVGRRCEKLAVPCVQGCEDKLPALRRILRETGIALEETAYVGNDVNDLECLEAVGLSVVVSDAHNSVRDRADLILTRSGGHGAVREFCEMVVAARDGGRS